MAGKTVARYSVDVSWKNNLQSMNKVKKEIENSQQKIERSRKKIRQRGEGELELITSRNLQRTYDKQIKREMDLHKVKVNNEKKLAQAKKLSTPKDFNSARRMQAVANITAPTGAESMSAYYRQLEKESIKDNRKIHNLKEQQEKAVADIENRMRGVNRAEEMIFKNQVKQTKTTQELMLLKAKQRGEITDILKTERLIAREMKQQNFLQQRLTGSIYQMVGGIGSAYIAWEGLKKSISTGIDYEGIQRAFMVVSKVGIGDNGDIVNRDNLDAMKQAGVELEYVKKQAKELGLPFREASKGYMSLVAAMNTKLPVSDIKTIFEGINQAGVALGLSSEGLQRITLAVKQMG